MILCLHFCLLRRFLGRLPLVREPPDEREEHRHEQTEGDNHGLGDEHAGGLVPREGIVDVGHGCCAFVLSHPLQELPKKEKERNICRGE